jgi:hypothetical protein
MFAQNKRSSLLKEEEKKFSNLNTLTDVVQPENQVFYCHFQHA